MKQTQMILLGLVALFFFTKDSHAAKSNPTPSIPDKSGSTKPTAPLQGQQPMSEAGQIASAGFNAAAKIGTSLFDWLGKSK